MRISRGDMFLRVAETIALRGTCPRAQVGAVIVRDNRIISMGYNGSLPGEPHCEDVGCELPIQGTGCLRVIHAEVNSILWAAREGIPTDQADMFATHSPCVNCAVCMVAAGIRTLYYIHPYRDPTGLKILHDHDIHYGRMDLGSRRVQSTEGAARVPGGADHSGDSDGGWQ